MMSYVHDYVLDELDAALTSYKADNSAFHRLHQACLDCNMAPENEDFVDWAAGRLSIRMLTGE